MSTLTEIIIDWLDFIDKETTIFELANNGKSTGAITRAEQRILTIAEKYINNYWVTAEEMDELTEFMYYVDDLAV